MATKKCCNPLEQTAADTLDYGRLQLDKLKLRLLDNFATLFNNIFAVLLIIILAGFALFFLTVALTWGLGTLIGSHFWAIMIVAGLFLIAAVVVYLTRKRIIINPAVRMLGRLMFEKPKDYDDEHED